MVFILVQLVVAVLATVAAGVKGLRFLPSELTDFELQRRIKSGDSAAEGEQHFRDKLPLLDALRRLVSLLLVIIIVIALGATNNFVVAVLLALVWLLVLEMLSTKKWLQQWFTRLVAPYEPQLISAATTLAPLLRLLADYNMLRSPERATFYSKEELLDEVDKSAGVLSREEKLLVRQGLRYSDLKVRDVMTPRTVVVTVEAGDTIGPVLLDRLHKAGHSRYPVVKGDLDHTVGVLYMHNLVPLDPKATTVGLVMDKRVYYVHQDKPLDHVLHAFLSTKHHLFLAVNEFEEVMGVITIEDVLEAIIGRKIVDEFDQYEDMRAVATLVAAERKKARQS